MAFLKARKKGLTHKPTLLANGDTKKQLLSRSRFALFKHHSKWTETQRSRAEILFDLYPDLEKVYAYSTSLCEIYQAKYQKEVGLVKLAQWENTVQKSGLKSYRPSFCT